MYIVPRGLPGLNNIKKDVIIEINEHSNIEGFFSSDCL